MHHKTVVILGGKLLDRRRLCFPHKRDLQTRHYSRSPAQSQLRPAIVVVHGQNNYIRAAGSLESGFMTRYILYSKAFLVGFVSLNPDRPFERLFRVAFSKAPYLDTRLHLLS